MMRGRIIGILVIILFGTCHSMLGQLNKSQKCIAVKSDSVLIPNEDIIDWSTITTFPKTDYSLDSAERKVLLLPKHSAKGIVDVCYRVLPNGLFHAYSSELAGNVQLEDDPLVRSFQDNKPPAAIGETPVTKSKINRAGSLSRGISFGNRQNLVVNSSLNLQIEGKLSDKMNIVANITDQNIPYQPEGNTQNLQDLDNVFVKLYSDDFSVIAGDIVLKNKENSHFLKYLKNVQGATLTAVKEKDGLKSITEIGGAVAKGKFASIMLSPIDGVQGPYQLTIPEAGSFAIILANSEKVFLDGKQLERGYDKDYTIDYNLAEITFTTRALITGFSRLRVDVEYSDQNYSRTILTARENIVSKGVNVGVNFYQARDNERRPLSFELTQQDAQRLAEAGDDASLAAISSIDSIAFDQNRVMYEKVDSLVEGVLYEVLVNSADQSNASFTASFANVGMNNGNYVREQSVVNGQVFKWVAPLNGVLQGEYAPLIVVPTPSSKRMISVDVHTQIKGNHVFNAELALSNEDLNLLSPLDDDNNNGFAAMLDYQYQDTIGYVLGYSTLFSGVHYELLSKDFQFIDRFRGVDFERSWGSNFTAIGTNMDQDQFVQLLVGLENRNKTNRLSYQLGKRDRGGEIDGFKQEIFYKRKDGKWHQRLSYLSTNNRGTMNITNWRNARADISFHTGQLTPGYTFEMDQTTRYASMAMDSIEFVPLHYSQHGVYLQHGDSSKAEFTLKQLLRHDKSVDNGVLVDTTISHISTFGMKKRLKNGVLDVVLSYRSIVDADADTSIANNLMSTLVYNKSFWSGGLSLDLNYNAIQSRELQREFAFVQVNSGEGTHTWRDENEDDVQSLNEFYEAINFDERDYIKIFLPTNNYILAFGNLLNASMSLRPSQLFGAKGMLKRFSSVSSIIIDQKDTKDDFLSRLSPLSAKIGNAETLAARRLFRSTIFFNRGNRKFSLDMGINNADRKTLLTNGDERIGQRELTANQRLGLSKSYTLLGKYQRKNQQSESDFLADRNYQVSGNQYELKIQWQPTSTFRLSSFIGNIRMKSVDGERNDQSVSNTLGTELRWSRGSNKTISASFDYTDIAYEGQQNTALSYVLLNALNPGVNTRWNINMQVKMIGGLQLTLSYNGRKSEGARTVNIGQMRVTALF